MYDSLRDTHTISSRRFQSKQTRQLIKAIAEMKLNTKQIMKFEHKFK